MWKWVNRLDRREKEKEISKVKKRKDLSSIWTGHILLRWQIETMSSPPTSSTQSINQNYFYSHSTKFNNHLLFLFLHCHHHQSIKLFRFFTKRNKLSGEFFPNWHLTLNLFVFIACLFNFRIDSGFMTVVISRPCRGFISTSAQKKTVVYTCEKCDRLQDKNEMKLREN